MTLLANRSGKEVYLVESSTSIASTPVAVPFMAPCSGFLTRVGACAIGTTTVLITCAVTINGSATDICSGALTLVSGSGNVSNTVVLSEAGVLATNTGLFSGVHVNEGDQVLITPSGGSGTSQGAFYVAIVAQK